MPLALFLTSLSLLQGCIAPAISDVTANYSPPFPDATGSLASYDPTSDTCNDLHHCRSLVGIVTSCVATIFACVWVAVHPNVPGPDQSLISRCFQSFKLVAATLLVPEWVLAWAMRQFLQAQKFAKILEDARNAAGEPTLAHDRKSTQEGDTKSANSSDRQGDQAPGMRLEERSTPHVNSSRDSTGGVSEIGQIGNSFDKNGKFYALSLVKRRSLVPPTADELEGMSKGDARSKSIAVFQTLWFVAQCIARRIENLAITNLEIMTLAYTVMTMAMYTAWWHKPHNVRCPIRVQMDEEFFEFTQDSDFKRKHSFEWYDIIEYIIGDHDKLVELRNEERVPTFWSSCWHFQCKIPLKADIVALSVAAVFGAVHCTAWSYAFPTLEQQWLWRGCAIAIAVIPLPMAATFVFLDPIGARWNNNRSAPMQRMCMVLGALLYIPARIILLVLSFTTLRHLPLSAYQTVQWTALIPHV
ncbi:hypothetical protein FIBSPDRAFT_744307 [Athelia psychrophila]|uniref:Uncharacterized protein n=1 Tax=Athelia psychrophila TaxID=1759441 RepID=A0A166HSC8_9AGAM|nr:hypothetical protein FIBSPDRAFT_744307 [Fibularhizoctonia sp. CBS 109695]